MKVLSEIRGAIVSGIGGISAVAISVQDAVLDMDAVDDKIMQMIFEDVKSVLQQETLRRVGAKYEKLQEREDCLVSFEKERVGEV